ncbi:MAG: alpha/beta fold hydrolase [Deltaproteobacteria bacterium]|nr:alpha/beta fold hydrolase [Deltaproteobacteria bacterium]
MTRAFKRLSPAILAAALCLAIGLGDCSSGKKGASGLEAAGTSVPEKYYIENLRKKDFPGGPVRIVKRLESAGAFDRYLIEYDSGRLNITGMMDVPRGKGPFPVVVLNHGHYDQKNFSPGLGFRQAADAFARKGYVAVGSDFRNMGGSDKGEDFFQHLGSLEDVLRLVDAVKKLPYVDPERIGMWGYSGGGWLTLKSAAIKPEIKAIAVLGSMSADDRDNYLALQKWHPTALAEVDRFVGKPGESPEAYAKLSAKNYLKDVPARVIIHHGADDKAVPLPWAEKLRDRLRSEGKVVEMYVYEGQGHVLKGRAWDLSTERTIRFFDRYLTEGLKEPRR